MMTDAQVEYVEESISKSNIKNSLLKNDLLDHMCCLIESELAKGKSFDKAFEKAYNQTSPNGYDEIERETVFLLNRNKLMNMKRLTFLSGFVFSLTLVAGVYMKILHFQGAGMTMGIGLVGFLFIFFPLMLLNQYHSVANQIMTERIRLITGLLSMFLIPLGTVMKFLHLPGAAVILSLGGIVFGFGFLPFLFFRMYKQSVEQI